MTSDPDAIGPDGTVRLHRYLKHAASHWFSAGCQGWDGCGHTAPISVHAAIEIMGSGDATVGDLERRLKCGRCGNRQVGVVIAADTRSVETKAREGPAWQTRAGLTD